MVNIVATRKVAGGMIEKRICPACQHAFWTKAIAPKSECADCDPPCEPEVNRGIGRRLKHRSDSQYHGGNYAA